jgi:hypothetical protein
MRQIAFLLGLLALVSCSRIEEVDAPWSTGQTPVLFAVLSPETPVQVYLGMTNTTTDSLLKRCYPEAVVSIRLKEGAWVLLTRQSGSNLFELPEDSLFPIQKGSTYEVKVVLGAEQPVLTGSTTVPSEAARIASASLVVTDTAILYSNYGETVTGTLQVQWDKLPQHKGGYRLTDVDGYPLDVVEGKQACKVYENDFLLPKEAVGLTVWLKTTDANLNAYLKTRDIQQSITFDDGQDISIILSAYGGVLPAFSSIENGVGLVGSYVQDSLYIHVSGNGNE